MQTPTWTFQDRLRKAREHAGLNQSALAEKLEVAPGTIQRWETGVRSPTEKNLQALAEATGVPFDWFYEETSTSSTEAGLIPPGASLTWTSNGIRVNI
ncbi:helix-turn-helix transcriptional regulator [Rothia sp. (in: high G+C Gram-positive bacteria)]|uniref:helix-turn-helix domain-containing protein n=1 Tax=Rothia sp. (in: high G+C Gram-positive bacteria) TaxID=1885016 RepID=UPI000EBC38E5|nr:XRE family transcriptional regulator [Rothia sp. (in: high G+C Gram-positive bacteria)]